MILLLLCVLFEFCLSGKNYGFFTYNTADQKQPTKFSTNIIPMTIIIGSVAALLCLALYNLLRKNKGDTEGGKFVIMDDD